MTRNCGFAVILFSLIAVGPSTGTWAQTSTGGIAVQPAFDGLRFDRPIAMVQVPGLNTRWYVAEQPGRILVVENGSSTLFADLSLQIDSGPNEAGLLGIAFHPDFRTNRQVYLSYTRAGRRRGAALTSVISRFTTNREGTRLDPQSEQILLTLEQPFGNHNGGHIVFGPDGFLYVGFGDGGSGGDPRGNGQNTQTLLGTLIRIDVDGGFPYAIPRDNPFVAGGGRAEIWAFGLRNPWRWSFDRVTGELWLADVGQNRWEEIDIIRRGGNYGWNVREGAHVFNRSTQAQGTLIEPVAEYSHQEGCSVTGGFVYRGREIATLRGWFLYADFCSGTIWGVRATNQGAQSRTIMRSDLRIAAFAEGNNGELFILDHGSGRILRLVAR